MIIVVAAFLAKHQDDLNEPEGIRKTCCNLWDPAAFDLETAKSFFYTRYLFFILGMIFMEDYPPD